MKMLTLPDNYMDIIKAELLKQVEDFVAKPLTDKSVTLKASLPALLSNAVSKDVPDQTIHFTAEAYCKLLILTQESKEEVAANCLVFRDPENINDYTVYDVLLYPQHISSATVQATDDYGLWLQTLNDEDFEACKMQMHSHVNMGIHPSAVDETFYQSMIPMINDFYIFMIFNKKCDMYLTIYDKTRNLIFENTDVCYDVMDTDNNNIYAWVEAETKKHVVPRVFAPVIPVYTPPVYDYAKPPAAPIKGKEKKIDRIIPAKEKDYRERPLTVAERKQLNLADQELHQYWKDRGYNYADNY